jgi:hypothetical protein
MGRNTSKAKAKREAASQVVVDTIKTFLADKKVSTKKRESVGLKMRLWIAMLTFKQRGSQLKI